MTTTILDRANTPRDGVDPAACWNLKAIYPDRAAWDRDKEALVAAIPALGDHRGHLGESPARLRSALDALMAVHQRHERLSHYAARWRDQDLGEAAPSAMADEMTRLGARIAAATAYLEPELLAIDEAELREWTETPELEDYDRYVESVLRKRPHVLTPAEETILANASALAPSNYYTYSTFADADLEPATFVDHAGKTVELSPANYRIYRQSHHRGDRKGAFDALWDKYRRYRNTFARLLSGAVTYNTFVARSRGYDGVLHMALHGNEVPVDFYGRLIDRVNDHLPSFHAYLKLRHRMLGIEGRQEYYDIYPSLAGPTDRTYPIDACYRSTLDALAPLGADYTARLEQAFAPGAGWIDVYPNKGKRSGAYMAGCYGLHPFVLLNHNDDFESLSTLAHEMGHAMHSVYSQERQPYAKHDYTIFVAEVASTLNEELLTEHLLGNEPDEAAQRFLLSEYVNGFRGTVFRQIMFAEFEREIYAMVERDESLTGEALDALYLSLLRRYHGHDEGVMHIDERYASEWAYIPHFYYGFYVYQYTSSNIASAALAERILGDGGRDAAARYIDDLLSAGSARPPLDILGAAGVDLTDAAPYAIAFGKFDRYVERLSALA